MFRLDGDVFLLGTAMADQLHLGQFRRPEPRQTNNSPRPN
jgi:hypothetical protein